MKIKHLPVLFIISAIVCCQYSFGQLTGHQTGVITDFGKQLNADMVNDNLHGSISVAVIKNNRVIWAQAFGYANQKKDLPADTNTIYRIGSVTKTFTATVLMQLVEEGRIKLDDPVETYVPEVKKLKGYSENTKFTFRQLASHTSGLKREPDVSGADDGPMDQWENKLLSVIPRTGFNSKPGEEFLYSNMGFAILGLALERITRVSYIQMVKERIFIPLHMNDTFFAMTDNKLLRLAQGMENNNKGGTDVNTKVPLREIIGRGYRVPNGGIYSTPCDLAKFVISMMEKPYLLRPSSLREMQSAPAGGKNYGLGLMFIHNRQLDIIGHNGSVPGYTAQFLIDQDSGYAVILMRNYNFGSTDLERVALDLLKRL